MTLYRRFFALIIVLLLFVIPLSVSAQDTALTPTVEFTLHTQLGGTPPMAFVGVGGDIEGIVNPDLTVTLGDVVQITLINNDSVLHDLSLQVFGVLATPVVVIGEQTSVIFVADQAGTFQYICSQPGHLQTGMAGNFIVVDPSATVDTTTVETTDMTSIIRNPSDLPPPVGDRGATTIDIEMTTMEVEGQLADGTTFTYWTFDGQVPGPMIRVREGDFVNMTFHNMPESMNAHSIDLHAVTGPGGGAVYTQTAPGGTTTFSFRALNPGLYVYHCATPSVASHIANGMYGLILVEPIGGLPPVDREFYVMQGEIYTTEPFGTAGHLTFDHSALLNEDPQYFVFNGAAMGLTTEETALHANVGETVRIYFGVGGPNFTSSFHVIGEIFDRVYDQASLTSAPLTDVQTTLVPPGGATVVEFAVQVPGRYILVDHALARLERGLAAFLFVAGEENPDIYHSDGATNSAGH